MDRDDWNRRYAGADLVWGAGPNRFLEAEVSGLRPGRALDLGCGEGRNAVWLAGHGWTVTAVDFSDAALDKGRRLATEAHVDVSWVLADLTEHRPGAEEYDLVIVMYVHLPPPHRDRLLDVAVEALRPGATLLVVGHDVANLDGGYGGPGDPSILLTPEAVTARLGGLHILRAERVRREVETAEGPRTAIDTLVRAERGGGSTAEDAAEAPADV